MGLPGRGIIVDGMDADLVVFDPLSVRATATDEQPRLPPVGIESVVVNGVVCVEGGRHTGATPGRWLRRGEA